MGGKTSKRKKSRILLLLAIGVGAYFLYIVIGYQQGLIAEKQKKISEIQLKLAEENKVNQKLKQEKDSINDDKYIEKIATEKLGMVKQGERVFVDVNK